MHIGEDNQDNPALSTKHLQPQNQQKSLELAFSVVHDNKSLT